MTNEHDHHHALTTKGRVLHSALGYDIVAWFVLLGREKAFRDRTLDLAKLERGQSVLDVGCGTGTLALRAKTRVGPTGTVHGIDPSPEMIARAKRKAEKARLEVAFETAVVEALPFPDARFDVLLATLMLHHLPRALRGPAAREMYRVVAPGGRVVAVDFGESGRKRTGIFGRLHYRHGRIELGEVIDVVTDAGFRVTSSGAMGMKSLHFVTATRL